MLRRKRLVRMARELSAAPAEGRAAICVARMRWYPARLILAAALTLVAAPLYAAFLPERFATYTRGTPAPVQAADRTLWDEYGFEAADSAPYTAPGGGFTLTAWRFRDPTGALAAWQMLRPAEARLLERPQAPKPTPGQPATPSSLTFGDLAAAAGPVTLLLEGNYVLRFEGVRPGVNDVNVLMYFLPRWQKASLPPLPGYLPGEGLVLNSERYILGPVSLERFEPRIPPSLAAFHLSAEGQIASYGAPKGSLKLVLFSYPTPLMARDRLEAFRRLPGAVPKRSGPLVAVIISPPDPDQAERLLARVRYEPQISWNEKTSAPKGNAGEMILAIVVLAAVLIVASVLLGIAFGGLRFLLYRFGIRDAKDPFTALHLGEK